MNPPGQLRLDVQGYALPLRPHSLAALNALERGHIFLSIGLDDEQAAAAEAAVAAVRAGTYPTTADATAAYTKEAMAS